METRQRLTNQYRVATIQLNDARGDVEHLKYEVETLEGLVHRQALELGHLQQLWRKEADEAKQYIERICFERDQLRCDLEKTQAMLGNVHLQLDHVYMQLDGAEERIRHLGKTNNQLKMQLDDTVDERVSREHWY